MIVAAREHERARIGKSHDGIVGADLADGIDRALAADDLHVEVGVLVIALLDGDEEIGVTAVVAKVGDERDVVERLRVGAAKTSAEKSAPHSTACNPACA